MKRILSILITIILVSTITCGIAVADSEWTKIDSNYASRGNATAQQWFSTEHNRALLTVLLAADVFISRGNFQADDLFSFLENTSYVGISSSSKQVLVMGYYGATTILTIVYTPSTNEIQYSEITESASPKTASEMDNILLESMKSFKNNKEYLKNNQSLVSEEASKIFY